MRFVTSVVHGPRSPRPLLVRCFSGPHVAKNAGWHGVRSTNLGRLSSGGTGRHYRRDRRAKFTGRKSAWLCVGWRRFRYGWHLRCFVQIDLSALRYV
jgi:hypothetical protein